MQTAKLDAALLFKSMIPKNLAEETEKELQNDFEELQRAVYSKSTEIRQHAFLHVTTADVARFGQMNVLVIKQYTITI